MDFLECKICKIPYDEEEHRPLNAPCGHEWCSACIKELIKGSIFVCPKCRQRHKVDVPDDFQLNFGLIDVIRAFKTQNISLPHKTQPKTSGASNIDVCKVHHKIIEHRCLKCQRWLCGVCLNSHTKLTGCCTISSSTAVKSMKDEHTESIKVLLSNYEEGANGLLLSIQEHNDKIEEITQKRKDLLQQAEEHCKEIKKIQNLLEQGKKQTEDIVNSKKHLSATDSPYAVMDGIEVLEEMQQALHSWYITNLGMDFSHNDIPYDISKALKENKDAYVEMVFKSQKRHGKISQHKNNIYFHTFRAQAVKDDSICMPFFHLQKLIPPSPSLVFMEPTLLFIELSLGGVVKGYMHLRLEKDRPNISEHMMQLVTGQQGHTLAGIALDEIDGHSIYTSNLPFNVMAVTAESNAKSKANRGDVMGYYNKGYLEHISFQTAAHNYNSFKIIGCIESGMDIMQECYANHSQGVVITDCGLVLKQK